MVSALFFGAATPVSKPLLDVMSSYHLAGLLYLGACLGVLGLAFRERAWVAPWRMDRANALRLLGSVVFGGMLGPLALLAGLKLASAASVSMWLNLEMVATAVLGHFFFRDHLTRRGWLAAGGILLAAILLAAGESVAGLRAGALVALACLCWGVDNHLTALIDGISPAQSTFWKGLAAGSTNLVIGLSLAPLVGSAGALAGGLLLGIFAYGLSIVLYITSAQQLGATRSQLVFSSAPFWGVLLSVVLLGERLTVFHAVAGVMFVGSIYFLSREQHHHRHTHGELWHTHPHAHDDHHDHHAGDDAPVWHSHEHRHEGLTHQHPHVPDLHHRHTH